MNSGKEKALRKIKIVRGQMDGLIKMIEEDRYCVDVSTQILATVGMLKSANLDILEGHLHTCVKDALETGNGEEKIDEILNILKKYM